MTEPHISDVLWLPPLFTAFRVICSACPISLLSLFASSPIARIGIVILPPPPYSSSRTQKEDARKGPNQQCKSVHLPVAIGKRLDLLAKYGIKRELDRTDIPYLLSYMMPRAWATHVSLRALNMVGLVPFDRAPFWSAGIQSTKGVETAIVCKQLDVKSIFHKLDQSLIDEASEEMARQLVGSKWGTGKMMRYAATGLVFRRMARLVAYTAKKKKEDAAETSANYQARKAAAAVRKVEEKKVQEEKKVAAAAKKVEKEVEAAAKRVAAAAKKEALAKKKAEGLAAKPVQARCKSLLGDLPAGRMAQVEAFLASLQGEEDL